MSPGRAIALGTFAVGAIDIADAFLFFWIRSGVTPPRILRGIAAGVLGPAARTGGAGVALFGLLVHFFIAFGVVVTYFAVSRKIAALRERPVVFGPLYGLSVWLAMNFVFIPLSQTVRGPFAAPGVINGIVIHLLGVGLPAALFANAARSDHTRGS
jgi:uncharacterized membrane protein YagU involved in acid resistance